MITFKYLYSRMRKKAERNKNQRSFSENSTCLAKELGAYHEDPIIDKKINEELLKFLLQQGLKKAKIIIKNQ